MSKNVLDFFKSIQSTSCGLLLYEMKQRPDILEALKILLSAAEVQVSDSRSTSSYLSFLSQSPNSSCNLSNNNLFKTVSQCTENQNVITKNSVEPLISSSSSSTSYSLLPSPETLTNNPLTINIGNDNLFQTVSQCTTQNVEPSITNFSSPALSPAITSISTSTTVNNNLIAQNPLENVCLSPLLPSSSNPMHNISFLRFKPKEALGLILNCKKLFDLDEILSTDLCNKYFITLNNFDHKHIVCVWKSVRTDNSKFKVFHNTETNIYSVLRVKKSNLIPVNETNENIVKFYYKFYKPICNNQYEMHIFHTSTHKLIQFIGKKPTCTCYNIHDQQKIFYKNKDLAPSKIFLNNPNTFRDTQQVNNMKRKCSFNDNKTNENKFRRLNNIADELQAIEQLSPDGFFQKCIKLTNNVDDNSIDRDLPAAMLFDLKFLKEMLFSALNSKLILFFDKTYNCAIYHLSTISFLSQRVLRKKTRARAQMLGVFLLHKSSCKSIFVQFFNHFKKVMDSLINKYNLNCSFESLFSFCTDQEGGIVSALKECFNNVDIIFCHIHVKKNILHKLKSNPNLIFMVSNLTKCKTIQELDDKYALILNSEYYINSNKSIKHYIRKIYPKIKNNVIYPIINFCKCTGLCSCSPITNNCAESANVKIKRFLDNETKTPLELIKYLNKLNELQLINIKKMFTNGGDFIFPGGSFELSSVDECFLDSLIEDFKEKKLFSSSIEECNVEPIKRRNFTQGGEFKKK